ncbi:transposase [Limibacter armeniacum]|uniref:transposase n=1 Tax=Limibacter armeniacum TaxID=466084 RepID=UPI002FE55743
MEEKQVNQVYIKRTQKDYTMSFKLQVVAELEEGKLSVQGACDKYGIQAKSTVRDWLRKFGNLDWSNKHPLKMSKTPEQRILELEQKVKLLERQKQTLEKQVERADKKIILFDMMLEMAEKEYNIPVRKNISPE